MKLDNHIYSLLYDHDCVIIPDFGGFVAELKPAQANTAKQIFYPPARRIAFNASLKNNDGLLAHHIAQEKLIRYEIACDEIKNYTQLVSETLHSGKSYDVEKVGTLFLNSEKNIQFSPDLSQNFLYDSFGLAAMHATVNHESAEELISAVKSIHAPDKKIKKLQWLELIPVAALLALILMVPSIVPKLNIGLSSLSFFSYKEKTPLTVQTKPVLPVEANTEPLHENEMTMIDNTVMPSTAINEIFTAINAFTNKPEPVTPAEATQPELKNNVDGISHYFIIAGCFRIEENAARLEVELKAKGFDAEIIGKNKAGLTMVSAASFSSLTEAENDLSKIQSEIISGAWIIKQ